MLGGIKVGQNSDRWWTAKRIVGQLVTTISVMMIRGCKLFEINRLPFNNDNNFKGVSAFWVWWHQMPKLMTLQNWTRLDALGLYDNMNQEEERHILRLTPATNLSLKKFANHHDQYEYKCSYDEEYRGAVAGNYRYNWAYCLKVRMFFLWRFSSRWVLWLVNWMQSILWVCKTFRFETIWLNWSMWR